ncbi:MAG: cation diffusion facilitator family transporter [Planctomycetota bacterium]
MNKSPGKTAILVSAVVSIIMLTGKLAAYMLTNSTAILADAVEDIVHVAATILAVFSFWYATCPADSRHPYGHGRIAFFSAGFEGALIFAASVAVIWTGIQGLIWSPQLEHLGAGIVITLAVSLINLVLGVTLIRIGRRQNNLILVANGQHALADLGTSLAAVTGVSLVMLTGQTWLDPLAALVIGGVIITCGISLLRKSYSGLMDTCDPKISARLLASLQEQVAAGRLIGFHQLRCRTTNNELWVDVHLLLPGELRIADGHTRITEIEDLLREVYPSGPVYITSHIEPADHDTAHPDQHQGAQDPLF